MERWLAQRTSAHLGASAGRADGVCANVAFPSPGRLVADAVAAASGIAPEADPWRPERAVWPLLEVVDDCLGEPWLRRLARHLGVATPALRRFDSQTDLVFWLCVVGCVFVARWEVGSAAGG